MWQVSEEVQVGGNVSRWVPRWAASMQLQRLSREVGQLGFARHPLSHSAVVWLPPQSHNLVILWRAWARFRLVDLPRLIAGLAQCFLGPVLSLGWVENWSSLLLGVIRMEPALAAHTRGWQAVWPIPTVVRDWLLSTSVSVGVDLRQPVIV